MTELGSFCNPENLKFTSSGLLPKTACAQTSFTVDTLKENVLLIFINGNSGRFFDPINTGTKSAHGNIVWAKKAKLQDGRDAFGFSSVVFKPKEVKFEFYELVNHEASYETKKIATFTVTEIPAVGVKKLKKIKK